MISHSNKSGWTTVRFFGALVLSVFMAGCSGDGLPDDSETTNGQTGEWLAVEVADNGFRGTDGKNTRAKEDGYVTTFTDGDQIGVYVVKDNQVKQENVCLTLKNGRWNGTLYYEGEDARYFAYYPYASGVSFKPNPAATTSDAFFAKYIGSFDPQGSGITSYMQGDLMTGDGTVSGNFGERKVSFDLAHRMAMLVVQLPVLNYTLASDKNYKWKREAKNVKFEGLKNYLEMDDGTYRILFRPGSLGSGTHRVSFDALGTPERGYTFDVGTLNAIKAGHYQRYILDKGSLNLTHKLQIGDFFLNDGSLIAKEADLSNLSDSEISKISGIVFWVGDATADAKRIEKAAYPEGCTHGLVVARFESTNWSKGVWSNTYDPIGPWIEWNTSYRSITCAYEEDNVYINAMLGYNNTLALRKCEEETNYDFPPVNFVLDNLNIGYPENTSGWYLPSPKELQLLCAGEKGKPVVNKGAQGTEICSLMNKQLEKCRRKVYISLIRSELYWTSAERNNPEFAFCINFTSGHCGYLNKADSRDFTTAYTRAILAF